MKTAVLGAGAFGTALAISLAQNGPVILWARDPDQVSAMKQTRENTARLPGIRFPDNLTVTAAHDDLLNADALLLVVPTQKLRSFVTENKEFLVGKTIVACCKGIEIATGMRPVEIIRSVLPDSPIAILTGPSFAADIATGLPTALTLACADATVGNALQQTLSTPNLRLYLSRDTLGAELGGALKNVVAIACGVAIGAGLGESARAAVMTRGYAELTRLAVFLGARPETLAGLSGFGDLVLTCTSQQSRNYRLGLSIGAGSDFNASTTVEGAATAIAVVALAKKHDLELPIATAVAALLQNKLDVSAAMNTLLSRPLKEE